MSTTNNPGHPLIVIYALEQVPATLEFHRTYNPEVVLTSESFSLGECNPLPGPELVWVPQGSCLPSMMEGPAEHPRKKSLMSAILGPLGNECPQGTLLEDLKGLAAKFRREAAECKSLEVGCYGDDESLTELRAQCDTQLDAAEQIEALIKRYKVDPYAG